MILNFLLNKIKVAFFITIFASILESSVIASPFEIQLLSKETQAEMIEKGIWKTGCPIEMNRLRTVLFTHYDFSGNEQEGRLVVLEAIAERVMHIFKQLYEYKFPISQAKPMEEYLGQDKQSMKDNNCSAFNHRPIAGKTLISVHSYGVAIDVNPVENPCLEPMTIRDPEEVMIPVQPAKGQYFLNRTNLRPGMVEQILDSEKNLRVVDLFSQNGFYTWGGKWNDPVDWQHFQPSRAAAEWLAFMSPKDATELFELYIETPALLNDSNVRDFDFQSLYKKNPDQFMDAIRNKNILGLDPQATYNSLSF